MGIGAIAARARAPQAPRCPAEGFRVRDDADGRDLGNDDVRRSLEYRHCRQLEGQPAHGDPRLLGSRDVDGIDEVFIRLNVGTMSSVPTSSGAVMSMLWPSGSRCVPRVPDARS